MQIVELECLVTNPFGGAVVWEVDSRSVVNPATNGRRMCHRPRFDAWKIEFTLKIDDKMFDERISRLLVDDLGSKIGLGDRSVGSWWSIGSGLRFGRQRPRWPDKAPPGRAARG